MTTIAFTQFLMPRGERKEVLIDRPSTIAAMAEQLQERGCRLEIEMLSDYQTISMEVLREVDGEDECLAGEICPNGPAVPERVDVMITKAFAALRRHGL